jgi:outer membrane receptor protein involved in Fe transport
LDSAGRRRRYFQRRSNSGPDDRASRCACPTRACATSAIFAQDEWRLKPNLSLVAGLRGDFYNVTTEATPGYDVASVVAGANPPVDPATLPDPNGATYTRQALTGDIGLVANAGGTVSPFVRYGRSYRHPNLEELLFAGPRRRQHRAECDARTGAGQQR